MTTRPNRASTSRRRVSSGRTPRTDDTAITVSLSSGITTWRSNRAGSGPRLQHPAERREAIFGGLLGADPHAQLGGEPLLGALELEHLAHQDLGRIARLEIARDEQRPWPLAVLLAACGPSQPETPGGTAPASIAGERPNLVLIIIDTLRADRLGCYGYSGQTSPELDALAADGVRFERVIAPTSWTRPSIGALLTGHHPRTLGLYREKAEILADRFTTLAELLRDNGYTTVGMTANPHINSSYNFDQGFATYLDSHVLFPFMNPGRGREELQQVTGPLRPRAVRRRPGDGAGDRRQLPGYLQINIMEVHEYNRGANTLTRSRVSGTVPRHGRTPTTTRRYARRRTTSASSSPASPPCRGGRTRCSSSPAITAKGSMITRGCCARSSTASSCTNRKSRCR